MSILTYFGYTLINIVILLLTGCITGCGIAMGFDVWKKLKSWKENSKNQKYIKDLEQKAAAITAEG